jgi:hypothetical protein
MVEQKLSGAAALGNRWWERDAIVRIDPCEVSSSTRRPCARIYSPAILPGLVSHSCNQERLSG